MGGRGSSSGMSDSGKKYGTEYTTLYQSGNIKFVRYKNGSATAPVETMKVITKSEQAKKEAAYKEDRRETNDFLNKAWYHAGPRPRKGWKGH